MACSARLFVFGFAKVKKFVDALKPDPEFFVHACCSDFEVKDTVSPEAQQRSVIGRETDPVPPSVDKGEKQFNRAHVGLGLHIGQDLNQRCFIGTDQIGDGDPKIFLGFTFDLDKSESLFAREERQTEVVGGFIADGDGKKGAISLIEGSPLPIFRIGRRNREKSESRQ
jgi:hypothetical protein